jgi:hypothetical protein
MSANNTLENALLLLLLNATAIANLADNAGTAPATVGQLNLHTASPGETGTAATNQAAYTSYATQTPARGAGGWTISGNSATLTSAVAFPQATGGSETETDFSLDLTTAGMLLFGDLTPDVPVSSGVQPQLTTATAITVD